MEYGDCTLCFSLYYRGILAKWEREELFDILPSTLQVLTRKPRPVTRVPLSSNTFYGLCLSICTIPGRFSSTSFVRSSFRALPHGCASSYSIGSFLDCSVTREILRCLPASLSWTWEYGSPYRFHCFLVDMSSNMACSGCCQIVCMT